MALYLWLMRELWKLGRRTIPFNEQSGFLDRNLHDLWPILLGVYWINAALVVMNYQFVNGFLFTIAGMLADSGGERKNNLPPRKAPLIPLLWHRNSRINLFEVVSC